MCGTAVRITALCLLLAASAYGDWLPDQRLTYDAGSSITAENSNTWTVAVSGDTVHAVWTDDRDGNDEIYYKRSTDGGATWGTDQRLTNATDRSECPSVAVAGSNVHVVWEDNRSDDWYDIYYRRSTDGGTTWLPEVLFPLSPRLGFDPSVAVSGDNVHVVWDGLPSETPPAPLEVYYRRSTDGGASWGSVNRLTNDPADHAWEPSVAVSGNNVHIGWYDSRDGNSEVYYKRSTDNGVNWGPDTRLTNETATSNDVTVAVVGDLVHVSWADLRDGYYEIYYKRSTDNGTTWPPSPGGDMRLTPADGETSYHPSIAADGGNVHLVWSDRRDPGTTREVYYKRSTDGGATWGADERLTTTGTSRWNSQKVALAGVGVHVVWSDNRDGNYEVYYKRNPTGNPALPTVTVTSPNGGETWPVGTVQTITCTHGGGPADTDSALVSRDGGSTWEFLFNAAAASSHNWTVTGPATVQARIRIVAINAYGTGTDDSDADFEITQAGNPDMGTDAIVAPVGRYDTMEIFTPEMTVTNYGDVDATYDAAFRVYDPTDVLVYDSTLAGQFLAVGGTANLVFPDGMTNLNEGAWTTEAFVYVAGDTYPGNDTVFGEFDVIAGTTCLPGWHETNNHVPNTPTDRAVKQGGWLAYQGTTDDEAPVFVHKGWKMTDFYAFYPTTEAWVTLTGMPYSTHPNEKWARKPPYKGSKGVQVGDVIYVTQGNNTLGFWSYHIMGDSWHVEEDVPVGPGNKKVKGGTDMTFVPAFGSYPNYVYLVKGYKAEFYRFNCDTRTWDSPLPDIPTGARAKMDKGSWCSYNEGETDGEQLVYVFRSKDGELYKYAIETNTFTRLADMPLEGWHSGKLKRKKPKDGGCASYWNGAIYALKGGNTQQFWKYFPARDSWAELETLPNNGSTGKKKRVKYGADLVSMGNGCFSALKGNKTFEMWCYGASAFADERPVRSGVMAGMTNAQGLGLTVAPNPLAAGCATLRYSLAKPGPAVISVFDVAGRPVAKQSLAANRTGAVNLDLRKLAAGIYLVRLDAGDHTATTKLVVQH